MVRAVDPAPYTGDSRRAFSAADERAPVRGRERMGAKRSELATGRLMARLMLGRSSPKVRWLRMTAPAVGEGGSPFKPGRVRGPLGSSERPQARRGM